MDCSNTLPRSGARDGDDFDTITAWRRLLKYTQRAGVTSSAKRRMRRRERRERQRDTKLEYEEWLLSN